MTRTLSAATCAVMLAAAAAGANAQGQRPNEPNPADRGGEFTITGCVKPGGAAAGSPASFTLTDVSAATGEGRAASAMGAGVPTPGLHSSASKPSDPPDIVEGDYRIVAEESIDLAKFANQQVEARGTLSSVGAGAAAGAKTSQAGASGPAGAERVFMATSVEKLSDSCAPVRGN